MVDVFEQRYEGLKPFVERAFEMIQTSPDTNLADRLDQELAQLIDKEAQKTNNPTEGGGEGEPMNCELVHRLPTLQLTRPKMWPWRLDARFLQWSQNFEARAKSDHIVRVSREDCHVETIGQNGQAGIDHVTCTAESTSLAYGARVAKWVDRHSFQEHCQRHVLCWLPPCLGHYRLIG